MFGWARKVTERIMNKFQIVAKPLHDYSGGNNAHINTNKLHVEIDAKVAEKAELSFQVTEDRFSFNHFKSEIKNGLTKEKIINHKQSLLNHSIDSTKLEFDLAILTEAKKADLPSVDIENNVLNVEDVRSDVKELFVEKIERKIKHYYLREEISPGEIRSLTPGKLKTKIKKDNRIVRLVPIRRHKKNIRHIPREELKEIWLEVAKQIKDNMQKYELIAIFDKIPVNYVENIKMEENWESIRFSLKDDFKEGPRMSKLIIIRHTETKKLNKVIVPCKEGN